MKNFYNFSVFVIKLILLGTIFSLQLYAQETNYSQLHYTPMQVNPAYVGNTDFTSVIFNYRTNRFNLDNRFNFNQLSVITPFYNKKTNFRTSGLGFSVFNDNFGSQNQFVFQGISLAYSRHVQLTQNSSLSMGIIGGAYMNKISPKNFTTGTQWVPGRGFNYDLDKGENFGNMRVFYFNSAAGLNYVRTDNQGRQKFNAGVSLFNMNRPDINFLEDKENKKPFNYVTHINYNWYSNASIDISSDILFSSISKVNQLNAGTVISYKVNERTESSIFHEGSVDLICRYIFQNYMVLGINFTQPNYVLGFSYDLGYKQGPIENPIPGTTEFLLVLRKSLYKKGSTSYQMVGKDETTSQYKFTSEK